MKYIFVNEIQNYTMSELPVPTSNQLTLCKVGNGALAGIAGVSASFPLDLIKTKFQLNKRDYNGKFINAARGTDGL